VFLQDEVSLTMANEKIEVRSYAGYRAEEMPRSLLVHGEDIRITEIFDLWVEEGVEDRTRKRFFRVKGSNGLIYRIYLDEKNHEWFLSAIEH
jgi:hypothetical protein